MRDISLFNHVYKKFIFHAINNLSSQLSLAQHMSQFPRVIVDRVFTEHACCVSRVYKNHTKGGRQFVDKHVLPPTSNLNGPLFITFLYFYTSVQNCI